MNIQKNLAALAAATTLALSASLVAPTAFAESLVMPKLVVSPAVGGTNDGYEQPCRGLDCGGGHHPPVPPTGSHHPKLDVIGGGMKLELDGSGLTYGDATASHPMIVSAYFLDESVVEMSGEINLLDDCLTGCGSDVKKLDMLASERHAIGIEGSITGVELAPGETLWVDTTSGVWSGIQGDGVVFTFNKDK